MNTFLKILVLIAILAVFYTISIVYTRYKKRTSNSAKITVGDKIYYIITFIAIVAVMIFTFPTYIFLSWNKLIALGLILLGTWFLYALMDKSEGGIITITILLYALFAVVILSEPIKGKELFEEPIVEVNTYSIAVSSTENNKIAVVKDNDEDGNNYYNFTYFDNWGNPEVLKIPEDQVDLKTEYETGDMAEVEEHTTLRIYFNEEIKEKEDDYITEEVASSYKIFVSDSLYYDSTKV